MPDDLTLTPDLLLRAYANGIFPMGEETGEVYWYAPDPRAVLPLESFHVPHNLEKRVRHREFSVTADRCFREVIEACADRTRTWITPRIIEAYTDLYVRGYAHSVEAWTGDGELAGGLYGVALGGAFFGESMFFNVSNASKVTLVHLVRQMRAGGFSLLDTQYSNPHLEQFGVVEIPREDYEERLFDAVTQETTWWPLSDAEAADLDSPIRS